MRRSALAALALALVLVTAPPAWAPHHFMQVDEVAPSGSQADQFIELRDPVAEPFPSSEYSVAATDGAGAVIAGASQTLPPGPFRFSTARFVIGGANVSARQTDLAFTIPAQAMRVCFYDGGNPPSGQIDCLNYAGIAIGPGQSAQRQSCGVGAAAATPGAANAETGCDGGGGGTGGGGGGTGGGGGGGGDVADLTPPQQTLAARRRQDVDRAAVTVTLNEAGTVTVRGRVNVPDAARVFRFRPVTRVLAANTPRRFRLKLARKARRSVKAALRDGRRLKARVTIVARDTSGNSSTAKRAIRLTD